MYPSTASKTPTGASAVLNTLATTGALAAPPTLAWLPTAIKKKGAFIINVCRGDVICFETLYKYLKNNHLRGAGSDVVDVEPIKKNHKLLKLSNFVYTPHIAGISDKLSGRNFKLIESNISRYANNDDLINLANIIRGY